MKPTLRFSSFHDTWTEKRLGSIGKFTSGQGFSEKEQGGKTGVPFFKVSDMNLLGNEKTMNKSNNYVSNAQINDLKYKPIKQKSIIFAKVGAAIFLERKRLAENFLIDNNMMAFTPFENIEFTRILFENIKLSKNAQIGALPSYNASDLSIIKIRIPRSSGEQQKIADFLTAVDDKITVIEKRVELLQKYKKGVMQQIFSQKIRLKDENGNNFPNWEIKKFDECLTSVPTKAFQIKSTSYLRSGKYPVVDQGQEMVAGYYNDDDKVFNATPVIIFGDHTTVLKFINFNFVVGADGTKIIKTKGDDLKYVYYFLQRNRVESEGYKRHFNILRKIKIDLPCAKEQQKIADFLTVIDDKIEREETKLEQSRLFKKSLLQQMFV